MATRRRSALRAAHELDLIARAMATSETHTPVYFPLQDLVRLLAVIGVVWLHVTYHGALIRWAELGRFAVPFFAGAGGLPGVRLPVAAWPRLDVAVRAGAVPEGVPRVSRLVGDLPRRALGECAADLAHGNSPHHAHRFFLETVRRFISGSCRSFFSRRSGRSRWRNSCGPRRGCACFWSWFCSRWPWRSRWRRCRRSCRASAMRRCSVTSRCRRALSRWPWHWLSVRSRDRA